MLTELRAYIAPGEHELRRVCAELGVEATLTCAVEPTSSLTPAMIFPPDVLRWAADYDITLDIDVMLWASDSEDE
jgi:hypothetical protein